LKSYIIEFALKSFRVLLCLNSTTNSTTVSWNWGGSHPSGTVAEVKAGEVSVTSHRGNEIKKTGDESNPAVHIERSGNDVVKRASELHIDEKGSGNTEMEEKSQEKNGEDKNDETEDENVKEQNGDSKEKEDEAKTGEKRKADEKADADAKADDKEEAADDKDNGKDTAKKQKTANGTAKDAKKGPGRPKSNGEKKPAAKKEKKVPAVGRAERRTRSQGAA
jgi:hypothetical protein